MNFPILLTTHSGTPQLHVAYSTALSRRLTVCKNTVVDVANYFLVSVRTQLENRLGALVHSCTTSSTTKNAHKHREYYTEAIEESAHNNYKSYQEGQMATEAELTAPIGAATLFTH